MMNIPMLHFLSWPKIALLKVLCGKGHCHGAKSSCPVKHFVLFDECMSTVINIAKLG
jgi:hypothetical protein